MHHRPKTPLFAPTILQPLPVLSTIGTITYLIFGSNRRNFLHSKFYYIIKYFYMNNVNYSDLNNLRKEVKNYDIQETILHIRKVKILILLLREFTF